MCEHVYSYFRFWSLRYLHSERSVSLTPCVKASNLTPGAHKLPYLSAPLLIRAWTEGTVACAGYATWLSMFPTCVIQIQLLIVCLFWYYSAFEPSSGVGKAGPALSGALRGVKPDEVFQLDADAVSVKRLRGTKVKARLRMIINDWVKWFYCPK